MRFQIRLILIFFIALACAGWCMPTSAEKADSLKPMEVRAASSTGNIQAGDAVMEGGFIATQGTRLLKADKALVRQDKDRNISLTLSGKEVTFREKRDNNEGWLDARADRVEYDGKTSTVKLIGKARLETDGNTLDGDVISYNLDTGAYNISGAGSGNAAAPTGQVRAVLLPAKKADAKVETKVDGKPEAKK
jgi:lipopolysaccharide export system protein LptA